MKKKPTKTKKQKGILSTHLMIEKRCNDPHQRKNTIVLEKQFLMRRTVNYLVAITSGIDKALQQSTFQDNSFDYISR